LDSSLGSLLFVAGLNNGFVAGFVVLFVAGLNNGFVAGSVVEFVVAFVAGLIN
jgi:hypothetical protein